MSTVNCGSCGRAIETKFEDCYCDDCCESDTGGISDATVLAGIKAAYQELEGKVASLQKELESTKAELEVLKGSK